MAAPTIPNGEEHFFTTLYEGNGAGQRVGKFVPFTDNATIANSCIFNRADTATMSRTLETPTNAKKYTFSAWVKIGNLDSNIARILGFSGGAIGISSNQFGITEYVSSTNYQVISNRTLEDTSKFYHFLASVDTTLSTADDRVKLYIDGDRVTSLNTNTQPSQDFNTATNGGSGTLYIGRRGLDTSNIFDGYLAEVNFVDGSALTPDTFGLTDSSTMRWIPKTLSGITYGNSGWRLTFADSSALGDDTSGNTNDFTVSNITSSDQTTDSPTQNHTTLSSSRTRGTITLSEGNLKIVSGATSYANSATTFKFSETASQGLYFEVKQVGSIQQGMSVTIMRDNVNVSGLGNNQQFTDCFGLQARGSGGGNTYWITENGSNGNDTGVSSASNDYIQVAFKEGKVWFGINNTWIGSGNPATGANPTFNNIAGQDFRFLISAYQNNDLECNFGQKAFRYTPPTDFVAVQQDNLPETAKGVSGLVWMNNRDTTDSNQLYDSSRGKHKALASNGASAVTTVTDGLQKFLKGGQQIEDNELINTSGESYVSWNWVGNSGTTSTNDASSTGVGTIDSTYQVNSTAGFSIVQYTGTGSAGTVKHGLSSKPDWMLIKDINNANGFIVSHKGLTSQATYSLNLGNTNAEYSDAGTYYWNSTAPTSSVFSIATDTGVNGSSRNYVAYCWNSVSGYSSFGKYVGNGNADGPFVYTGFKPAVVIVKSSSNASTSWEIRDNKRSTSGSNPVTQVLYPDLASQEYTTDNCDFLSNGFKWRSSGGNRNESGYTYIYMAFAEHPFVGDGTNPVTAR